VNGEETRYLLDTSRPHAEAIEEYAPDGEIKTSYVHGLDLISRQSDENSLYYLQDGHSGVRQLSNGLGEVTDFYNYDAYGRLLHSVGGSENNYLYRGEQFDPNVGLQYLRSRYYNPDNGRFASVDPFEGLLAEPMSRHRYLYGNANPVTYVDPSGEYSMTEVMQTSTMAGQLAAISPILSQAVGIGGTIGASAGVGWLVSRLRRGNWREWSGKANASTITPSGLLQSTIGVPVDPTFEGIHIEASSDWDESSVETGYTKIFAKWLVGNLSLSTIGGGSPVTIPTSTDGDDFVSYTKQELGPNPLLLTPFTLGLEFNFIAEGKGGVGVSSFLQGVGLSTIYSNSPPPGLFAGVSAGLSILMPGSVKYERGRPTPDDP
jgi:RHS repeat-associated protein